MVFFQMKHYFLNVNSKPFFFCNGITLLCELPLRILCFNCCHHLIV